MSFGADRAWLTGRAFRRRLSWCLILVLAVQGLLVQAHVHAPHTFAGLTPAAVASAPDLSAVADQHAQCRLCQEYLSGGNFLAPAAAAPALPSVLARVVPARLPATASGPYRHFWQSRAPPLA